MINTVLMPLIRREVDSLLAWIAHCPNPGMPCNILFSLDLEWTRQEKDTIVNALNASALGGVATPCFIDCEIPESDSFYIREADTALDLNKHPYGTKSGPNTQFFRSLRKAIDLPFVNGVILMEVDAYPVKRAWLREINQRTGWLENEAYVIGARAEEEVAPSIRTHLNGNAIYLVRSKGFKGFLDGWEKALLDALKTNRDLAYDVILDWRNSTFEGDPSTVDAVRDAYESKAIEVPRLIMNLSNAAGRFETVCDIADYVQERSYAVVHGRAVVEDRDLLREYYYKREQLECARRRTVVCGGRASSISTVGDSVK